MSWLLRRLVGAVLLLVAVSAATFALDELAPGEPFAQMRLDPHISPDALATLERRYGLDDPLVERYLRWLGGAVRGDLGHSFARNLPVTRLVWPRVRNTLLLAVAATCLTWLLSLPLGIAAAARPGRRLDRLALGGTTALLATPELVLALLAVLLAARTGWFPTGGMATYGVEGGLARAADVARHLVLPSAVLALGGLPVVVRHVRAAMIDALADPAVRAARACGVAPPRLVLRHALPLAANPMTTLAGLSIAGLLSASFVVEIVFGWPGLGALLLNSIHARDVHVIVAAVLLSCLLAVAGNLAADLLLRLVDPRVRSQETS